MTNDKIPVLTGEGEALIAEFLSVDLTDLKRAKIEREEAEREEKQRAKAEREREEEARKREARRKLFGDFLRWGMVRAWRTNAAGVLTEIHDEADLTCPHCGERPEKLQQLIVAYGDILNSLPINAMSSWTGRSLNVGALIKSIPGFRVEIPCACGKRTVYGGVYLPEGNACR